MQTILAPVAAELRALEPLLVEYLLTPNAPTNQVMSHIFSSGGKRIRPALFLLCARLIGLESEHRFPIASVCEYIHTASLLHDDVIDNSTVRRNRPTANSIWGDETAVLAGDLIYSAACRLMVKTRSLELIDTFAECIRFMSESELYQLELLWKIDTSRAQYERVVAGKTAALFEASAMTPAFLQACDPGLPRALGDFGRNLGFAFQIADDCLDYEGTVADVGKNLFADLLEGKVTLPLILALQGEEGGELRGLVSAVVELGKADAAQARDLVELVRRTGGLAPARAIAQDFTRQATAALDTACALLGRVPPAASPAAEAVASLRSLCHFVIERKN